MKRQIVFQQLWRRLLSRNPWAFRVLQVFAFLLGLLSAGLQFVSQNELPLPASLAWLQHSEVWITALFTIICAQLPNEAPAKRSGPKAAKGKLPLVILLCALPALLGSCLTQSKVEDWNRRHPEQAATYCAQQYPCKVQDSTVTEDTAAAAFTGAAGQIDQAAAALAATNDSLLQELQGRDTLCAKYAPVIRQLQAGIANLRDSLKKMPPKVVTKTVKERWIDNAAVTAATARAERTAAEKALIEQRLTDAQTGRRHWRWAAIVSWLLIIAAFILQIRNRI